MSERVIKNPLLPGAYPDPSICRVDDDYYMVCSSFELYPGIPIFHSRDLAHWEQIGHVMDKNNDLHVEAQYLANGVMAPTIRYHDGTFYVINCNFCDDGNFIVTAKDPAGPWSKPHWLSDVPGIDASIFFDDDGKTYIMGTGNVVRRADGTMDRGIWAAEYDIDNFRMIGEPTAIWDSALRVATSPESPHIYKVDGYYYLVIAEGGTEHYHSVAVARSREVLGWYEGNPANPVMTHRQFGFHCPIANVGHADLVDTPSGNWYAVLLASRTMEGIYKNLGRETFICPVIWERGWPVFSPQSGKIDWEYPADPSLEWTPYPPVIERDNFDAPTLDMCYVFWGTPYGDFWRIEDGRLHLRCLPRRMSEPLQQADFSAPKVYDKCAAFIGRRQQHFSFDVSTAMHFTPEGAETAGLMVMQASNHQYRLERAVKPAGDGAGEGQQVIRLVEVTADFEVPPFMPGFTSETHEKTIAEVPCESADVVLRLEAREEDYSFYYSTGEQEAPILLGKGDGRLINPEIVGGMMGIIAGMFASGNHTQSENEAEFDWFSYEAR